jgi:general secretion pathway protein B
VSYVLDALKKADAERERGAVPGLHAQPMPGLMNEQQPGPRLPVWVWLLAGASAVLLLALLWLLLSREQQSTPSLSSPTSAQRAEAMPSTTPVPAPPVLAQNTPPVAPPPAMRSATPAEPATPRPTRPRAEAATPATPSPATASVSPAPVAARPPETAKTPPAPATPPAAPAKTDSSTHEGRVFALNELPEDVRRSLPPLNIGGSIYSENPASRFVIINGQVFHENDKVTPEITLEQIHLKLAVLRYRDLRFRLMF